MKLCCKKELEKLKKSCGCILSISHGRKCPMLDRIDKKLKEAKK